MMTGARVSRLRFDGLPVQVLLVALLVLPWVWPLANGPSPAVQPWLASLACGAIFLLVLPAQPVSLNTIVAQSFLVAALTSSVIGLLQYFDATAFLGAWVNKSSPGVAFANLRQRNQFATLTTIGLVALVCLASGRKTGLPTWSETRARPLAVFGAFAAAILLVMGNAASSSRTGLLQLLLILGVAGWWRWYRDVAMRRLLLAAVLAYALTAYALPSLIGLDPFTSGIVPRLGDTSATCESRRILWANVLHLISLKPWFGWGWGELDYAHFVTRYPGPRFCDILDNAHNLPLHLAVELGVPCAIAVCGLGLVLIWRARPWCETEVSRQMAWAILALILLHSMLEYPLWYGPFQIATGLCVWMLSRSPASVSLADAAPRPGAILHSHAARQRASAVVISVCALGVLAAAAYAAWDYYRVSQIYRAPELRAPAYRDNTSQKIQGSWLFRNQVRFAELTTSTVTADNAATLNRQAHALLHFSPETRVVEKLIDSAIMLGRTDEATYFMARYRSAFAADYARWSQSHSHLPALPDAAR